MKNSKGITLIALVVTIIVLLILAGISIAMLTGDNGIITRTNQSKMSQIEGQVKEEVKLAVQSAKISAMQTSVASSGGNWFANMHIETTSGTPNVISVLQEDLTSTKGYDSITGASSSGTNASTTGADVTIHYTTPDYKAATNDQTAYIQAVVTVTGNDFSIKSFNACRAGSSSTANAGTLIDLK